MGGVSSLFEMCPVLCQREDGSPSAPTSSGFILLCVFFSAVCLSLLLHSSIYPLTFAAVGTNLAKMEPLPHFFLN